MRKPNVQKILGTALIISLIAAGSSEALDYCTAFGGCDEYIYSVSIGSIYTWATPCSGYANYTSNDSTTMQAGQSYNFTVATAVGTTVYAGYPGDQLGIWVDWNIDGDFYDSGELCALIDNYGLFNGSITVPTSISNGISRMRVRLIYTSLGESMYPCGSTSYGEVEDYRIFLTGTGGSISGVKFKDLDADGVYDFGEQLPGWEVYLDLDNDGIFDYGEPNAITNDPNGIYEFTNLAPDTYTVAEVMRAGWVQTYPGGWGTHSVTVTAGSVSENINFGNTDNPQPVTISGYVGVAPSYYGLKDVAVSASTGESTITDIYGYYELTLSNPWTGTINVSKGDWTFSPPSQGFFNITTNYSSVNFTPIDPPIKYWGGSGTEWDPYIIRYGEDLQELGANPVDWNKHFELYGGISLSDYTGEEFNMIGFMTLSGPDIAFTGTFNGNGNSISNFHYEKTSDMMDMIGIFGYVNGATISDVTVSRPEVDGGDAFSTGSLVGYMQSGTVTNCSVDGMIETSFVKSEGPNCGGLIGIASEGTLSNCSASIDVTCPGTGGSVGGLTGVCGANLSNCKAEGTVIGDSGVGGLAGSSDGSIGIEYCQTNSIVSGQEKVGGLVGITYSPIKQSFSTGSVTVADSIAGGLVGINIETTIEDCYSTADVTGVYRCGGLVGFVGDNAETALISNCYATGTISASHTSGSLVGQCFTVFDIISSFFNENGWDNGYGTPISTAEMQTQTTFTDAGWDFVVETANGTEDIWKLYHPQTYPKLSWEKYGGTGTLADPFLIYSPEEMNAIGANPDDFDKCFKLMADIDLSMYTGSSFNMIGRYLSSSDNHPFEGIFDGNGHTISSFTYTTTSGYVGLFSYVSGTGARADIRDLTLTGVNINSSGYNTGGLVGHLGGVVSNCSVEGTVTGGDDVGGLVGDLYWGSIYDCSSTGSVNGDEGIGGLVGDCYVGEVINCYSTSSVTGNSAVGGLAGEVASSKIYTCYAAGIVSGTTDVGGFAGFDDYGFYTSCFWNQTVNSGLSGIGNAASSDVVGHTTLELQTANTFTNAGWDFAGEISNGPDDDWGMPSGGGYPELWWQLSSLPALPAGLFSSGSGTLADPYLVSNATELNNIGRNPQLMDKHFKLVSDIDLKGTDLYMIGGYSSKFNGVFDGGGHKVSNFTKDTLPFGQRLGFFQAIDTDGCVESLSLTDPNVGSEHILHSYNGGFASSNYGTIKNCMVSGGDIKSYFAAGGIAGTNAGTITNCYSSAMTTAENISGGLVGFNAHGGLITKSVSAGKTAGDYTVGGIAGTNLRSTVSLGHSLGDITGIRWIGGIVGENHGTVVNCYSQSKITSSSYSGGIVGTLWAIDNPASVLNCYSAGVLDVAGTYGGTIGADFYGTVENCFFDSSINPGISGSGTGPDPDNAIGLSTAEMQTASTFINSGWDFYGESGNGDEDLWIINEGYGYPVHFWERVNLTGWFGTDLADFAVLSSNWQQGCNLQCNKCDIIEDGSIDFRDFAVIMANWSQADCDSCGRADLSGDGNVTILDVQEFAECWLDPYDCLGSDIDFSGQVDISDLLILAEYWLE